MGSLVTYQIFSTLALIFLSAPVKGILHHILLLILILTLDKYKMLAFFALAQVGCAHHKVTLLLTPYFHRSLGLPDLVFYPIKNKNSHTSTSFNPEFLVSDNVQ